MTVNPLPVSGRTEDREPGRVSAVLEEGRCIPEREEGLLAALDVRELEPIFDLTLEAGMGLTRPPDPLSWIFSILEAGRKLLVD